MFNFKRLLSMDLPQGQSAFLWGARKTGKSFYLKNKFKRSQYYDLLKTEQYWRLLREPQILRYETLALPKEKYQYPIIIDEVQKVPQLLNEVHWLIENSNAYFILCGSSARKLKREGANMLGGRAWRYEFYPLVYPEIPNFELLTALNKGLIPSHYTATHINKTMKAYIQNYLTEEIKAEALTKNLVAFAQFLELAAFSNGEIMNFSNIARECGIDNKTVKEYYQILVDTLLGYFLRPYHNRKKREHIVATPKFYLFDVGVVNGLKKQSIHTLAGSEAGKAFEHYMLMELIAHRGLKELDYDIHYWRTQPSGHEVDFVLGKGEIAIEIKITSTIQKENLRGLTAFYDYAKPKKSILVCNVAQARKITTDNKCEIDILPWKQFLQMLWDLQIVN